MEKINEDSKLNYRVVETNDGFKIQKERLKNVGFILWPIWEKVWTDLDSSKNYCHWSVPTYYYKTEGEAVSEVKKLENPTYRIVYETK